MRQTPYAPLTLTEIDTYLIQKEKERLEQDIAGEQTKVFDTVLLSYEQQLQSMPPLEKLELYKELQSIEQESQLYEAYYLDEFRFFNMPQANANFDHYLSRITWTKEEAVALCLGKEPDLVNSNVLNEYVNFNINDPSARYSAFINHYFNIKNILLSDTTIADREPVLFFLHWFNENKIIIHVDLRERVIKRKILSYEAYQWIDQEIEAALNDETTDVDDILSYKIGASKNDKQSIIYQENMHLRAIAVLLEFIEGHTEGVSKHGSFTNHTKLVELLAEKYGNINKIEGFSRRTLMPLFRLAKSKLKY